MDLDSRTLEVERREAIFDNSQAPGTRREGRL
jgi:hypothetical protein